MTPIILCIALYLWYYNLLWVVLPVVGIYGFFYLTKPSENNFESFFRKYATYNYKHDKFFLNLLNTVALNAIVNINYYDWGFLRVANVSYYGNNKTESYIGIFLKWRKL